MKAQSQLLSIKRQINQTLDGLAKLRQDLNAACRSLRRHRESICLTIDRFNVPPSKLIGISEAARLCGVSASTIERGVGRETLPPRTRVGKRDYWTTQQLPELRKAVEAQLGCRDRAPWEQQGLYTEVGAARLLNMPIVTFRAWLGRGDIDPPTRTLDGLAYQHSRFYDKTDIRQIKGKMTKYFARSDRAGFTPHWKSRRGDEQ